MTLTTTRLQLDDIEALAQATLVAAGALPQNAAPLAHAIMQA